VGMARSKKRAASSKSDSIQTNNPDPERSRGVRTREAHKDLEWFRPPERKTLRPLCVVLLGSLWNLYVFVELEKAWVLTCALSLL
jgi:hypothetical protein